VNIKQTFVCFLASLVIHCCHKEDSPFFCGWGFRFLPQGFFLFFFFENFGLSVVEKHPTNMYHKSKNFAITIFLSFLVV